MQYPLFKISFRIIAGGAVSWINLYFCGKKKDDQFVIKLFCPQAGLALPFPFDEKEAKILSKRTLSRAF
jgi:hypothetical protein